MNVMALPHECNGDSPRNYIRHSMYLFLANIAEKRVNRCIKRTGILPFFHPKRTALPKSITIYHYLSLIKCMNIKC